MKLYRLERNGLGPFTQFIESDVPYFQVTREDVVFKKGDNPRCFLYACDSKKQLKEFFGEEQIQKLLEVGFKLKEYNVPKKRVRTTPNNKQYAFHRGDTEKLIEDKIREMMRAVITTVK